MKRVIIGLVFVLVMAPAASAAITLNNMGGAWVVNVDGSVSTFAVNVGAISGGSQDGFGENYTGYIWINYPAAGGYNSQLSNAQFTTNVDTDNGGNMTVIRTSMMPSGPIGGISAVNNGASQYIWPGDIVTFDMVAVSGAVVGDTYQLKVTDLSMTAIDTVTVTVVPPGPIIGLSNSIINFIADLGGADPADKTFTINNPGIATLNWQITESCPWLTVSPLTGSSTGNPNTVTLSVDISGLSADDYTCQLTVTDPAAVNNPETVTINLEVTGPVFELSSTTFDFSAFMNEPNPSDQILSMRNIGGGALDWQITESCSWLSVDTNSGSSTGEWDDVALQIDTSGLAGGYYTCEMTIADPAASNSPQTVDVSLYVDAGTLHWPFDTDANDIEGGFDGTFVSDAAVTNASGQFRIGQGALTLDGIDDRVSTPYLGVSGAAARTTCAWFKCDGDTGDHQSILSYGGASGAGNAWRIWIARDDGHVFNAMNGGNANSITTGLWDGQWHHVAVTFPAGGTLIWDVKIYVDGYEDTGWYTNGDTQTVNTAAENTFEIGMASGGTQFPFDGQVDDVRVYDRELSDAEIFGLYATRYDADIDGDGSVGLPDFAFLALQWQDIPSTPSADIAPTPVSDNFVGIQDLQLLALSWLNVADMPEDMVPIPAGEFQMGDHHDSLADAPVHMVYVDAFYIGRYEVTSQQYSNYLNAALLRGQIQVLSGVVYDLPGGTEPYCETTGSHAASRVIYDGAVFSMVSGKEEHPITEVSWYGAAAYCSYYGYRLPTEAEWEYAARGGNDSPYYRYPWGDTIDGSMANYNSSGDPYESGGIPETTPVGYYDGSQTPAGSDMANGYGLYDMAGNVFNWCNDWYDASYYTVSPTNNPTGPASGTECVMRSCAWSRSSASCAVAVRDKRSPDVHTGQIGFRVALNLN